MENLDATRKTEGGKKKKEAGEIYVPIPVCGGVSFLNAFNTRRRGKSSLAEWSLVKVEESDAEQQ